MPRYRIEEGYIDTDLNLIEINKVKVPPRRGRPGTPKSRLAALILADAWTKTNFSKKVYRKEERFEGALPKKYSDDGSQRRAIRDAKKKEKEIFEPHTPGDIIYGETEAVWFTDKVTKYNNEILGYAWVWCPGRDNAVFTIVKATIEGNLEQV